MNNVFDEIKLQRKAPIHIVHGTDWWTDCDDIVALRLLLRAHKAGIIELECIGINAVMEHSAASVDALVLSEGLEIPIGIDKSAVKAGKKCRYQSVLAEHPHRITNADCDEAYRVYRRALAGCEEKCDITEVGFPQIIHQLLLSEPDDISPLNGTELVKEKVNKIWMMAGSWGKKSGYEYNLICTPAARKAGNYICEHSPVPITFLGFEVGKSVKTGGGDPTDGDLLKIGMAAHGSKNGRSSWDPMLTLLAIINSEEQAGYQKVCGTAYVNPKTGKNSFSPSPDGRHAYVVKTQPDEYYASIINCLIK